MHTAKSFIFIIVMIVAAYCLQAFIEVSQEEIKSKPLIYGNNTTQINGKTLYFKELQKNVSLPKNAIPLKLSKDTQTLKKEFSIYGNTYHRFKGNLEISGILQYSFKTDWSGVYKEWILFFDEPYYKSKLIPKNKPYPDSKEENMPDTAYMKITENGNKELQKLFDLAKLNPLAFIGVRVTGKIKELDIITNDGDEWDFFGKIEHLKPMEKVIIKYPNSLELNIIGISKIYLSYTSKDSFINLRESPNGKILTQIQKTDMLESCEYKENKGLILNLGQDSTNPQWLKVAYIPPEAKDTSKAIYGVIHESQVSWECGKN